VVPFQLLSYEEQDEYGHSVYITCDSTQIDDSQQSSSVSNFFFLFTIVPWCLFALFIFRDFAKKAFGARQIDLSCGSGKRRTIIKLGLAIAKDVSMPKLFVKCIPENEDDKQTIIIYDDLGDHIGKYGKFDIKVNQRQLRSAKAIYVGISSDEALRGEQIATLSYAKIVFPSASEKNDSSVLVKDAIIYDPIELVNNIPVKLQLEDGTKSSEYFDELYNSTSFASFNWCRKVEEILVAMIVGFIYVGRIAFSSQSGNQEVVGLFGGAVKVDTLSIGYYHRIQDPWDTDVILLVTEAVLGGCLAGYVASLATRYLHGLILLIRPPVNISVETKCYTKKIFTKKRAGPKRKEIIDEMFLLQNNPDMCIESYGRMLGKLNKQGQMSETNYDWEIHSHGELVEYIQIQNGSSEGNQGSVYTTVYDDLADFEDFGKLEEEDDNGINKAIRRMTVKNSKENIKASGDGKLDPEAGDNNGNTKTGKQSTVDVVKETPAISAGRDPRVGKGFGFVSYFWIIVSLVISGATIAGLNGFLYTLLQTPKIDVETDLHMGGLLVSIWSCQIICSLFLSTALDDFVFRV
jgi:hypothetical protein